MQKEKAANVAGGQIEATTPENLSILHAERLEALRKSADILGDGETLKAPNLEDIDLLESLKLSQEVRKIIDSVSNGLNTPPEYLISSLLTTAGAVAGHNARFDNGRYINYPFLWLVLVGRPGAAKSPALNFATSHLEDIDASLLSRYLEERKQYKKDFDAWQFAKAQAMKKGQTIDQGDEPEPPKESQIIAQNVTIEKLYDILNDNGSTFFVCDEFTGLLNQLGAYKKSSTDDLNNWLTLYNSSNLLKIQRKKEDTTAIKNAHISVLSTTQPEAIRKHKDVKTLTDSGFFQRFNFVVATNEKRPDYSKHYNIEFDAERWREVLEAVRGMFKDVHDFTATDEATTELISTLEEYDNHIYTKEAAPAMVAEIFAKAKINIYRLSLAFAVLRIAADGECTYKITIDDVRNAAQVQNFCNLSAARLFLEDGEQKQDKKQILREVLEANPDIKTSELERIFVPLILPRATFYRNLKEIKGEI